MKRLMLVFVLALVFCLLVNHTAQAQKQNQVVVGGQLAINFRVPAGGFLPEQRATMVDSRIVEVLSAVNVDAPGVFKITRLSRAVSVIGVGHIPLVTVTKADAKANGDTIEQLARIWKNRLKSGLLIASPRTHTG